VLDVRDVWLAYDGKEVLRARRFLRKRASLSH